MPSATLRTQDIVALNVNMVLPLTGLMKRDLAKAMGIKPQSIARLLSGKQTWSLDQAVAAANFLGLPLDMLMNPNMTPASALEYIQKQENGGLAVADDVDFRCTGGACALTLAA